MDTPNNGTRRPVPKRIGFIGKPKLSNTERSHIQYIGRCLARLGHTAVLPAKEGNPTKGVAAQIREGMEVEDGKSELLGSGIIDTADVTFIFPDKPLLQRLHAAYPNLEAMPTVILVKPEEVSEWSKAFTETLRDYELPVPEA